MLNPQNKLFRWGPISACPLFMYFTIEPSFAPMKKLLGLCYPESLIIFQDNKVTWLLDEQEVSDRSKKFAEQIIFKSDMKQKYFTLWDKRTGDLLTSFDFLDGINLASLDDKELIESYEKFKNIYWDWWTLTMSVELVTVSIEPALGKKLKNYYQDEHPKEYNQAFSVLTSPLVLTFYRQEQKELLKIFALPKQQQEKAIKDHQQKFYWIYNSYFEGKILDVDFFKKELEKIIPEDYQKAFAEIENYPATIRRKKKKITDRIKPDSEVLELISLVEKFGQLQDERKMNNFRADHYLELFVQEFARRTKNKVTDLKFLLSDELGGVIENVDRDLISKRKECFALECTENAIESITGKNGLALANQFANASDLEETIIHGILASAGETYYFRGIAKIILTVDELDKIQEGDILVTTMTSPDFVIGMKKAGAIITDTGGILCHAAIVSRELRKPCIVGTQISTKVIKDGDIVELHCGRGTVKIIKHE